MIYVNQAIEPRGDNISYKMHYLQQSFPKTAFSTSFILDNAEALDCNDIQSLIYIKTILVNLQHYS